ncbi:MAG: hypothetical protein AAF581_07815 [Planctomycetota bacterium]
MSEAGAKYRLNVSFLYLGFVMAAAMPLSGQVVSRPQTLLGTRGPSGSPTVIVSRSVTADTGACPPIADLCCSSIIGSVEISWTPTACEFDQLDIRIDGTLVATVNGAVSSFSWPQAVPGTTHFVEIVGSCGPVVRTVSCAICHMCDNEFIRGDCNDDGVVNLTDAVFSLGVLFAGGGPAPCLDACDATDDGSHNISDPVRILGFLFSGAQPPPTPSPPACGVDPSADCLGCDDPNCP